MNKPKAWYRRRVYKRNSFTSVYIKMLFLNTLNSLFTTETKVPDGD